MFAEVAGQREEGKAKGSAVVRPIVSAESGLRKFSFGRPKGLKIFEIKSSASQLRCYRSSDSAVQARLPISPFLVRYRFR